MDIYRRIPAYARRLSTAEEMRSFDRRATEDFGIPSLDLMERAGRHVFETVMKVLSPVEGRRVAVIAGKGNNGGDGFVAARYLHEAGIGTTVILLARPESVVGDAARNLERLYNAGIRVEVPESGAEIARELKNCSLVVDAILGTGLKGDVSGIAADAIQAINSSGRMVVAVDIPSGIDANTGRVWGICVNAHYTVTFALPKIGLIMYPGALHTGEIIVADIGIPHQLYEEAGVELVGADTAGALLPARPPDAHKGTFGTVVVLAGAAGYTGAAALSSEAVLRAGAGLSILATPTSLQPVMSIKLTEVITRGLPETDTQTISSAALPLALELCKKASAVVLGCGLGTHADTCRFVSGFVPLAEVPVVLDADGLNCIAGNSSILEGKHGNLVITPHPGEMGRLLGITTNDVQSDRIAAALEASKRFNCVTVLKGARTLIADNSGRVYVNPTGNSGLATAGTGDVLAGTIGGLISQGLRPVDAAVCGAYVHGLAGDIAAAKIGSAGMLAGDVLRSIPSALAELYGTRG